VVSEKEIKDWYNRKHCLKGENAWRPFEAYSIFLDYLNAKPQTKLLDIGCGTGYLLKAADQRGLETYGLDISDEAVKIAESVCPKSKIIVGKGEDIHFADRSFDYVTCLGALEHFLDIERGINEMARVGKDDALFCIMVPNAHFVFWRIRGRKGTEQQDINENLLTLRQWKALLENNGLAINHVYHDRWFMNQIEIFSTLNPLSILKNIMLKLAWLFLPLGWTYQFVIVCRKR